MGKIMLNDIEYSSGSGSSSGHNYSTIEQVVGTWIDGRDVYEMTLTIAQTTALSDLVWTQLPFNETEPSNIDKLIDAVYTGSVPNKSSLRFSYDNGHICGASDHSPSENVTQNDAIIFRYVKTVTP